MNDEPKTTVIIRGDQVDVEEIMAAIRGRITRRKRGAFVPSPEDLEEQLAGMLSQLEAWNFPTSLWRAMWPPHRLPWNHDEDVPLATHRASLGSILLPLKRFARAVLRFGLRPVLHPQMEINRTLALMVQILARAAAQKQLRIEALDARVARLTGLIESLRGDMEPLLRFEDPA